MITSENTLIENKKIIFEFLNRKKKYLNKILEITKNTEFINTDRDAEVYVLMIEKREKLFNELRIIDENLSLKKYSNVFDDSKCKKEIDLINKSIQNICDEIVKLDININKSMEKIYFGIKDNLKNIKKGGNLNSAYNKADSYDDGYLFDKKN